MVIIASLALTLVASGCKKQKPAVPQAQAQAPTLTSETTATDQPGPTPPVSVEPSRPLPTPGETTVASNTVPKNPPKPRHVPHKTVPPDSAQVADQQKKTVVVPNAGNTQQQQPNVTASITNDAALHQKLDTSQLIEATESTLRGLNRALSSSEEAIVQHIRSYIKESQSASQSGDFERAYNLALKAHLLSDDLTKK